MEMRSPALCPSTITVRRNPPRKARATPASAVPLREPLSSPSLSRDIFSTEVSQNPNDADNRNADNSTKALSENLKVYLRIRPLAIQKNSKNIAEPKNVWPKNPKVNNNSRPKMKKSNEMCVEVNDDLRSVTVSAPPALREKKRIKSEVYEGFSRVFATGASQSDVYEEMVKPLVEDFLKGKSGMLASMGPSGSGKTHTVFGSVREPGMVPLALRHIFSENESNGAQSSRVFYLSMFEISSEKGKAERIVDLLHDRGDICMQNSVLRGLKEAVVCDAQQAESLIAQGMLKRATAMTNSNSQSSRSQCIINIRCDSEKGGEEVECRAGSTMLTIVDLAGAEREKKTGNQGARLLESNFINNTSMVFGLCLRSLLEHQKNRNKPLQKHYQNSLLTRYLRDYLEGKKRMMLILTVKPGVEDYLDTSFLLRQASPFTKIKFKNLEEPTHVTSNKRPNQSLPQPEQLKKLKLNNSDSSSIDELNIDRGSKTSKEIAGKVVKNCLNQDIEDIDDENLNEIPVRSDEFLGLGILEKSSPKEDYRKNNSEKDREYQIMQGLSKAMWTILKQYKEKLEEVEIENRHLRDSLVNEKTRSLEFENELASQKMGLVDLEIELNEFKSRCTCFTKTSADVVPDSSDDASLNLSQYQMSDLPEVNSEVSSYSMNKLDQTENKKKIDPSQLEDLFRSSDDAEDLKGFKDNGAVDVHSRSEELSASTNNAHDLVCYEDTSTVDVYSGSEELSASTNDDYDLVCYKDTGTVDLSSTSEATSQLINMCPDINVNSELESECVSSGSCLTTLECETAKSSEDYEDRKDATGEPTQLEDSATAHIQTVNSSESLLKDEICVHEDEEQLNSEEGKLDKLDAVLPKEGRDGKNMPKFAPKLAPCSNFQHTEKPKRRLLPASSLLVKDISVLDIMDDHDNPKGARGGRRVTTNDKNRTQGSLSLLNLLTSKLDR